MKHMAVAWIAQKGPALRPFFELSGFKRHLAPARHQAADIQTPVGVEVVHHPIVTLHTGQALVRLLQMGHEIGRFAGAPDRPGNLTGGHCQRVDQHARAMADVFMFTSLTPTRLGRFGGGFALQHLHAGFFIAADHQAVLLVVFECLGIKLAYRSGFGIKVLIMAVEPVFALVGLQINLL